MKIVLVILSGSADVADAVLRERFPGCEIVTLARAEIDRGGMRDRLRNVRSQRPDVFAIMTESLAWQYGLDALMLFGALSGAGRSVAIDARGGWRGSKRAAIMASAPLSISMARLKGRSAVRRAARRIASLERETGRGRADASAQNGAGRVVYLRATPAPGTQPGGATSHINGVVNGLLAEGADVTLISNDLIAGLDENSVDLRLVPPDNRVMPRAAFDLHNGMLFTDAAAAMIAREPPSFIYQRYCRFSFAGVEASLGRGVPLFLEYNGSEVWIGKHWDRVEMLDLLERCERLNLAAASRIFVISEVERNNLLDAGVPDHKIVVNPNGVDTGKFHPDVGGAAVRQKYHINEGTVVAGFLGTFGPWHGVLELADAIALVPREANIHFLLIGDGSLRHEVEERLRDSGDLDRVTMTGVVGHDQVPSFLDACDILVSPHVPLADGSEFFGSPTKLFEYMAMGKAIVASRLGQIGEVLVNGETAVLVEPGESVQLARALESLAGSDRGRSALGTAARAAAIAKHTWRRNAAIVLNAYRELC